MRFVLALSRGALLCLFVHVSADRSLAKSSSTATSVLNEFFNMSQIVPQGSVTHSKACIEEFVFLNILNVVPT